MEISGLLKAKSILLDADDTLWFDNIFYMKLKKNLMDMVEPLSSSDFEKTFNGFLCGYGEKNYVSAVIKVADHYGIDEMKRKQLDKDIEDFKNYPIILLPYVLKVLKVLTNRRIILVTVGEAQRQMEKIKLSNLREYFSDICIVESKEINIWENIYSKLELDKNESLAIGNSVQNDIIPNDKLGVNTIFLDHKYNYFGRDSITYKPMVKITSWKDILYAL